MGKKILEKLLFSQNFLNILLWILHMETRINTVWSYSKNRCFRAFFFWVKTEHFGLKLSKKLSKTFCVTQFIFNQCKTTKI